MPYIEAKDKERIDQGGTPETSGELTYAIQRQLRLYLEHSGLRYMYLADCLGALEGAKLDLIGRVINPYEKRKQEENGDVWPETLL